MTTGRAINHLSVALLSIKMDKSGVILLLKLQTSRSNVSGEWRPAGQEQQEIRFSAW